MNTNRKLSVIALLLLVLLICCAVAPQAQAGYNLTTMLAEGNTNSVAYGTTSNAWPSEVTTTCSLRNADKVVVYTSFKLTATGTGNIILGFSESVDGVNYPTTATHFLTNAATSATAVKAVQALTIKGGITLKLVSIENADDAAALTNIVVKVGVSSR